MKTNMMHKLLTLALAGVMTLSLAACGSKTDNGGSDAQQESENGTTYKVAVIKQLDHASLDEIANAITAELDKLAAGNGVTIEYEVTSGQNDPTILKQLSDQAIADNVDAPSPARPRPCPPSPRMTARPPWSTPPSLIPQRQT